MRYMLYFSYSCTSGVLVFFPCHSHLCLQIENKFSLDLGAWQLSFSIICWWMLTLMWSNLLVFFKVYKLLRMSCYLDIKSLLHHLEINLHQNSCASRWNRLTRPTVYMVNTNALIQSSWIKLNFIFVLWETTQIGPQVLEACHTRWSWRMAALT